MRLNTHTDALVIKKHPNLATSIGGQIILKAVKRRVKRFLPYAILDRIEKTRETSFPTNGRKIIHEDQNLLILVSDEEAVGEYCLVSFTGIGRALGGIDVQTPEFTRSGLHGPKLFVVDKHRTWGNHLDLNAVANAVSSYSTTRKVVTLGNSMGGFLAILTSSLLKSEKCIAFAPQWSISPSIVPQETRWMQYRKQIRKIIHPDLSDRFSPDCEYLCLFGCDDGEKAHSNLFPRGKSNLQAYEMFGAHHNVADHLKTSGCLYPLIDGFVTGRSQPETIFDGLGIDYQQIL